MERRNNKQKVTDYSGSSEHLKKDLDLKKTVDVRLRILIAVIACLGSVLIYRVFDVTMVQGAHFSALLEKFKAQPIYAQTMRGEIYDRNLTTLVSNKANKSIVYTAGTLDEKNRSAVALLFGKTFNIEYKLSEDDLKVLWLRRTGNLTALASTEEIEQYRNQEISTSDFNNLMKSRITQEHLNTITDDEKIQFEVLNRMSNFEMGQTAVILESATVEQISYLAENASLFPGFSYSTTWSRDYNRAVKLGGLFGSIGQISSEKLGHFLASGYSQNDLVGTSGLEYQYENVLSGVDSQYSSGDGSSLQLTKDGRKGYDIRTSIDLDLQKYVEEAVQAAIEEVRQNPSRQMFEQMHMVVSNPQNGDILAVVAIKRNEDGTYWNDVQSTMLSTGTYPVGSVVKIGTVYMGLNEGVIDENELILDTPMYIQGSPVRASWTSGIGRVNARTALQHSSNIYMYQIAIRLAGTTYIPNGPLIVETPKETYDLMRKYYSQFGLGIKTEIDFPREEIGFHGSTDNTGNLLDFAIGQFDNYNAMELSQYVNTIANDGYRVKPRYVIDVLEHDTKNVIYQNQVEILNSLDNKKALDVVQEGMRIYITTGSGYALGNETYTMAGKSGTAQDWNKDGDYVRNSTYIVYAPYEKPVISISCIAPSAMLDSKGSGVRNVCGTTSTKVMTYYMTRESKKSN